MSWRVRLGYLLVLIGTSLISAPEAQEAIKDLRERSPESGGIGTLAWFAWGCLIVALAFVVTTMLVLFGVLPEWVPAIPGILLVAILGFILYPVVDVLVNASDLS